MTYDRGIQLEDQEINANKFEVKDEMLMGFDSQQENEVGRSRYKVFGSVLWLRMSFSEDVAINARCLSHLFNDVVSTVIITVTDGSTCAKQPRLLTACVHLTVLWSNACQRISN